MAGFNKVRRHDVAINSYEGGAVYEKSPINEWVNILFSSFLENGFYESALDQQERFIKLTDLIAEKYGYEFVAKASIFARNELGMRSISQLVAAWLNDKSFENKRLFYRNFMHRPDDVAEIFAAIDYLNGKRSHALIRGAADYLSGLSAQTLAKYKLNSRDYNMYDLINITHAYSKHINDYKNNCLEKADTWEVNISTAKSVEEKNAEWRRLVETGKIGYMALIRNLNNILDSGVNQEWINDHLIPLITDKKRIKNSLIFPYRFFTAYKNLQVHNLEIDNALGKAFITAAIHNAPQLDGPSAIILDVSGSMTDRISYNSNITLKEIGACFAISLVLSNPDCLLVKFGNDAKYFKCNILDNPFVLIENFCKNDNCGCGTYIIPAFEKIGMTDYKKLKRIFLISDMQVMDSGSFDFYNRWQDSATKFYNRMFKNVPLYSFDLGNYHTQIKTSNDPNIHYITALNDQVFKFIGLLESNINLVDYINTFNYY